MSDTINDGGMAFPNNFGLEDGGSLGISKRDYFAAMALQGILANADRCVDEQTSLAAESYEIADAMLAARK